MDSTIRTSARLRLALAPAVVVFFVLAAADPARAQATPPHHPVVGTVEDQTSAMLPGAEVTLTRVGGSVSQTTKTSDTGLFRFDDVTPGVYELRAQFEGFLPATARLDVRLRAPRRQRLVLRIAGLEQEITVRTESAVLALDGAQNRDAVAVDEGMLADLPIFDRDVVSALSTLLDPSAAGTGGTTLVVDGMEGRRVGVPASAIQ